MAGLPLQYPDLALHLCDQARTPIISSASLSNANNSNSSSAEDGNAAAASSNQKKAAALDELAATALRARDTASRLGLGLGPDGRPATASSSLSPSPDVLMTAPQHVVVTYNTGAVLIESFMDPREHHHHEQPQQQQQQQQRQVDGHEEPDADLDDGGAPLLVGLVAAPGMQSLRDARRATVRMERVGRAFQHELAAEQRRLH